MNSYETVLNNDDLKVKIILPPKSDTAPSENKSNTRGDSLILGYLENPFMVETSANWSDTLFGKDYATRLNQMLGLSGQNIQLMTPLDTQQQYIIANIPTFTFSFYVIATNSNVNPMKNLMRLYEAIFPEKVNNGIIKPHWGYRPNALGESNGSVGNLQGNPSNGTVIVTIGKWFRAINLIITDVRLEYSDTPDANGRPIWVKANITFKPRRLPYANEFIQMFITDNPKG